MKEIFDVIIIGAGASGLAAAWNLSSKGLKVACFEQGKKNTQEDFIPIEKGGELQKFNKFSFDSNLRNNPWDYYINSTDSPIHIANYNGVGGSTFLFSAQYPRFHESDFKTNSTDNVGVDWPITLKDIEPYYNLNDKITGVAGLEGDTFYPNIKDLLPPVPLGPMGIALAKGFKKLNWHWWPAYSALLTKEYRNRAKDKFTRPSNIGDISGSKGSTENTYLPLALENGLVLKERCIVTKLIEVDKKIKKIEYIDNANKAREASASIIVVACSGIGTPRLLLQSKSRNFPNGLTNSSNLVGHNLMLHPLGYAEGIFNCNLLSNLGPQGCCMLSQEFYKTDVSRGFKRGYTFQVLRGPLPIESSINLTSRKLVRFGNHFWEDFLNIYNHTAHLTVIIEDLPEDHNRVTLDENKLNSYNLPGVNITYRLSDNSKKMLAHGLNNARKILKVSGAAKTFAYGPVKNTGWHTLGTCRMGNDPKNSIVNKYGKSHDIENLFIVDSSIFPTSSGVNPASTVQSMALYISDNIYKRYLSKNIKK